MKWCENGHEEIVHDERNCPLCTALDDLENAKETIEELKAKGGNE